MYALVSRQYALTHPMEVSRLFGMDVYLGMLFDGHKTLLQRACEKFSQHRLPMFGKVGDAYRLATLFELRVAKIYGRMAERFRDIEPACSLFRELQEEEEEHARVMSICLYTVKMGPEVAFVPSVRDADIRREMQDLRAIERRVPSMTLDQALRITDEVERSEVNVIFGRLLKQVEQPETCFLQREFHHTENHSETVPRRTRELREHLAELGLNTGLT